MTRPANVTSRRAHLLAGAALLAGLGTSPAFAQRGFEAIPTVTSGSAQIFAPIANAQGGLTDRITVQTQQLTINWTPTDNSGTGPINILPLNNRLEFISQAGVNPSYTVLNRIIPADPSRPVVFSGTVQSRTALVGLPALPGGSIWFYSPGGFIVNATARFDVGSLVLSTVPIDTVGGLFGPSNTVRFGPLANHPAVDPSAQIVINPGALITSNNLFGGSQGSYVAMVAPQITQGGTINANGSVALLAAEAVNVSINSGLFGITFTTGSGADNPIVHTGITTGPSPTAMDNDNIVFAAVAKNTAITLLLGGQIGYSGASAATDDNGSIILSSGYSAVQSGVTPSVLSEGTAAGNIDIGTASFISRLRAAASHDLVASPTAAGEALNFTRQTLLSGRNSAILRADQSEVINFAALDLGEDDLTILSSAGATGGTAQVIADYDPALGEDRTGIFGGSLRIVANGTSATTTGQGGTAELLASGAVLQLGSLTVEAIGSGGVDDGIATDGVGGTARIRMTGDARLTTTGSILVNARGIGGSTSSLDQVGGSGTGGTAGFDFSDSIVEANLLRVDASGFGGNGDSAAGNAQGGTARAKFAGGESSLGTLDILADGDNASALGLSGGQATGGTAALELLANAGLEVSLASVSARGKRGLGTLNDVTDPRPRVEGSGLGGAVTLSVADTNFAPGALSLLAGGAIASGTSGSVTLTSNALINVGSLADIAGTGAVDLAFAGDGGLRASQIEILTRGPVTVRRESPGQTPPAALEASTIRIESLGAVTLSDLVFADQDLAIRGAQITAGTLRSGGDLGFRAAGAVDVGELEAGDEIVVLGATAFSAGRITAGFGPAVDGAGDALRAAASKTAQFAFGPVSKVYDGATTGNIAAVLGGIAADDNVSGSIGYSFASRNVGSGMAVEQTGISLSGANLTDYAITIASIAPTFGDVTKRPLSVNVAANNKTYDRTTAATGSITIGNIVAGDDVGTSGTTFTFADRNAGTGKTVNVAGTQLIGQDAGNYTLDVPATVLADILKKALTAMVVANGKTYDGTTAASGTVSLGGVIAGDDVDTVGTTFTFGDRNAGAGKAVNVAGTQLIGQDAGNYTVNIPATVFADILKKVLSATAVANGKTYDGTTAGTGTVSLTGVIAGDSVGTSGTTFTFADRNAGTGKTVNVAGTQLTGLDAGNYTVTVPATVLADILKKALTATVVANGKTYDGTTAGTGTVNLTGVIAGDNVGTSGTTFTFADRNAGTGKTVNVAGTQLTGRDAGNYTLNVPASALANIFSRAITVTAGDKTKSSGQPDPALTFTITGGELVAGDTLTGALARAPGVLPGVYPIERGTLSASANYTLSFVPGSFTITFPASEVRDTQSTQWAQNFLAGLVQQPNVTVDVTLDSDFCSDGAQACALTTPPSR